MKTPMQELFHRVEQLRFAKNPIDELMKIEIQMLEKEKEVMCEFQDLAQRSDFWVEYDGAEGCFDKTFNTKRDD